MAYCLSAGYKLNNHDLSGEYIIKKVIGCGASTIAYLADFKDVSGRVSERILKEYYPSNLEILRDGKGVLLCTAKDLQRYQDGINRFIAGGDRQNTLRECTYLKNETPPLQKIFKANNTCYLEVTPFEGKTFDNIESFTLLERIKLCLTISKLIKRYHEEGLLYLDIKPQNILVLTNSSGDVVTDMVALIDFDSVIEKDAIVFGNSLSFTEAWAAPEQITPHGFSKVSEATDVYALGELVFWCVFGRHSTANEHRGFSTYPYNEITSETVIQLLRNPVKKALNYLFHNTLRSSVYNRFSSADDIIRILETVCEELSKKEELIVSETQPKEFFVGREKELLEVAQTLNTHKIVFVSGIAGVGKSELIKQYVNRHKNEYDNILYWTYEGNLDTMVSNDKSVSISNFVRLKEETDSQYATRKLSKIRELCATKNNLFVIDNMDGLIDEVAEQETWELIKNLSGRILVTTRSVESLYRTIRIEPLEKIADLIQLFCEYCPVDDNELDNVEKIIEEVNHHTLLTELLAHYTRATHSVPKATLEKLTSIGIGGLSKENVRLLKDERITSDTVFEHIEQIFSMTSMSDEQLLIMSKLALMPSDGICTEKFVAFFSIEDYENINWLLYHGWVHNCDGSGNVISLHPTIASVVIEHIKTNPTLLDNLYRDNYNAIRVRNSKIISEAEQVSFADDLALSTANKYRIRTRSAAVFVEQYFSMYSQYGNREQKFAQIDFAIETLESIIGADKYSGILEQCYYYKATMLSSMSQYDMAIELCEKHYALAKNKKDYYFSAKWCIVLSDIHSRYNPQDYVFSKQIKYYFIGIYYALKIERDNGRKKPRFLTSANLLEKLDYDYLGQNKKRFYTNLMLGFANWMENQEALVLFCSKCSKHELSSLNRAKNIRERIANRKGLRNNSNNFEIIIDNARIAFLSQKYEDAEMMLKEIVDFYDGQGLHETYTLYRVHQFLGQIALRYSPCDYGTAITEFEECLRISEKLISSNTYMVRLELGYCYILAERMDEANKINTDLWHETQILAPEIRKTYYADALRNMGYLYYLQGNHFVARNMLRKALQEYDKANAPYDLIGFGKARTYKHLSDLYFSNNLEPSEGGVDMAINRMEIAIELYKSHVGLEHPEAQNCLQRLEYLKSTK